jgi:hypothetical protein
MAIMAGTGGFREPATKAKPVATKTATPKVVAKSPVKSPAKSTTNTAQDAVNRQKAIEALRGADNVSMDMLNRVPDQAMAPVDPAAQWTLESDPLYQMALAGGQSEFNYSRNAALADKQTQESMAAADRKNLDTSASESRRRLAGNYAARGMAGGAAGALSQAEARANAEQIAARPSIQNKIDALNQQFLSNYGAVGSDWTGTLAGQQYKSQAAQQALSAQLARYGSI